MEEPVKDQPSKSQLELFDKIKEFTTNAVVGFVSICYKKFGPEATANAMLPLIVPFAEVYFNNCIHWIQNRNDVYLNKQFDAMVAIDLGMKSHPVDILNVIVPLCLTVLNTMDCSGVIGENYESSMKAVRVHVSALIETHRKTASTLTGCPIDHNHIDLEPGTSVYTFITKDKTTVKK